MQGFCGSDRMGVSLWVVYDSSMGMSFEQEESFVELIIFT